MHPLSLLSGFVAGIAASAYYGHKLSTKLETLKTDLFNKIEGEIAKIKGKV